MGKKTNKDLTFVIVGHSNWEYVNYFLKIYDKITSYCEMIFIFDNVPPKNILDKIDSLKIKRNFNFNNKGKILKLIESRNLIKSRYFKISDYDDFININDIKKIANEINDLSKEKDDYTVFHNTAKIFKEDNESKIWNSSNITSLDKLNYKNVYWPRIPNASAIYPSSLLEKISNIKKLKRQNYFNDDLLSSFSLFHTNSKMFYSSAMPYIQFHSKGQTNKISYNRIKSISTFYSNLILFKKEYKPEFKILSLNNTTYLELWNWLNNWNKKILMHKKFSTYIKNVYFYPKIFFKFKKMKKGMREEIDFIFVQNNNENMKEIFKILSQIQNIKNNRTVFCLNIEEMGKNNIKFINKNYKKYIGLTLKLTKQDLEDIEKKLDRKINKNINIKKIEYLSWNIKNKIVEIEIFELNTLENLKKLYFEKFEKNKEIKTIKKMIDLSKIKGEYNL